MNNHPQPSLPSHEQHDCNAHRAFIGLGSNMGDSAAILTAAIERIDALLGVALIRASAFYKSKPAYREDQEMFRNAVIEVRTTLEPLELLKALQGIEDDFERSRLIVNGPRTLDLDIIDYEGVTSDDDELMLPHPLTLERDFVVTPLLEIAPGHVLANGQSVTDEEVEFGTVTSPTDTQSSHDFHDSGGHHTPADPQASQHLHHTHEHPYAHEHPHTYGHTPTQGMLSICATPIGNLGDITQRVVEALSQADCVLAEDTRVARKLLSHLNIRTKIERCDEYTIRQRIPNIIERVRQGSRLAFVSDAGMPGICDPGAALVAAAREAGCPLQVLPGASALLTALVASGLPTKTFYFGGFLPRKKAQIVTTLTELSQLDATLVFFESPHRAQSSLAVIAEVFPNREAAIARELTKIHEEVLCAGAQDLVDQLSRRAESGQTLKGELAIIIGPPIRHIEKRTHKDRYAGRIDAED